MGLIDKLKKNSKIKETATLDKSVVTEIKDFIKTDIPLMNLALSGDIEGGLSSGLTVIAGPSRHFKSNYALKMGKAFLDKYDDGVILFYDSEFGSTDKYFENAGIDPERVVHTPITNIEELKFDIMAQIDELTKKDNVMILVDSIGNLASKKEVEDALKENTAADMTRAKQLKSLFRMITPHLTLKGIPCVAINHTYQCGTEKMTVTTPDGVVSIKDIKQGDTVLTTEGYEEVLFTTTAENAAVTEIEMEDGTILEFTEGHRFMVDGEWVYVENLVPGMEIDIQTVS